ncbi:MAG: hypothetical protein AB2A00_32885 [Myxococcota bacterium]
MDENETLRLTFDHSWRLGRSYARHFSETISLDQLPDVLATLETPCLGGSWHAGEDEPARFLTRAGCEWGRDAGLCDYWREAADGMVLGLSGEVRHTRHRSVGHGDPVCVDVLFADADSRLRFGEIPDEMRPGLQGVRSSLRLLNSMLDVEFLGVSEGVLLYRLHRAGSDDGGLAVSQVVEQQLTRRFPHVKPMEWTHRAVFDATP